MGYTTYRPDKVADKPIATIEGEHGDVLTITYLESASDEMREYWDMSDERWYWVSEVEQGIPIPATILAALSNIGSVYRRHSQKVYEINLVHKHVHYLFNMERWFSVYPSYHMPEYGLCDKRPYLNDCFIGWNKMLDILQVIEF